MDIIGNTNKITQFPGSLHNHTQYSNLRLRDCIIKEEDLIKYAVELGHEVVGITDHEAVCNAVKVEKIYKKIKKDHPNFKVILGNEIYLCRNGLNADNFNKDYDKYYHFCLYAKDVIGHQQIREISTRAWKRSYMARGMRRVPTYYQDLLDIIGQNPGHVIGSTACLGGALPTQLMKYKASRDSELNDKIVIWCNQMNLLFGQGNFFLELQPSGSKEQTYVNQRLVELSKELNIPYIITTDSHYLKEEDKSIHKAYLNAQNGDREVDDFYATTYMMNTEQLESHLDLTEEEFQTAYQNILNIKDMCKDYSLTKALKIPQLMWKIPQTTSISDQLIEAMPYLRQFLDSDFEGDRVLAYAIVDKVLSDSRLQNKETYDEIDACLEMTWVSSEINNTHWSSYYLNLQKIIDECWSADTLVGCGRGSGVGFILLYLLDITQINPLWETTKTFRWRFLNPDRVSVLDVDVDIEGGRRKQVLSHLRETYGEDRVANVATFSTEKSKSAILTACRGLGIDIDIAQYLASMVSADRGTLRTLDQTFYGDEEAGFTVNHQFVREMTENYPEVWEVAHKIEGLICRLGEHAGGVIFVDEPFENSTALMRAPNGDIITQYDLHDCEDCSLIKYDLLSVEALDKMHICIDLLTEYGYVNKKETLKETYEDVIGIYNLERDNQDMWKMVWNHDIQSLFQMEKQSGIQGIALTHPQSVDDLAVLNSVIRLMAQEKGAEQPLNKFARFKKNPETWYDEMRQYGLTEEEQKYLEPIVKISYGICESQEKFMQLVQMEKCGGFNLTWADKLRKSIAKKNPAAYEELQKEYFEVIKEKGLSERLCNYVWNVLIATSRGYGFNASHTLAYSLIALQEMNLAHKYPILFWNCACLISDSGGAESDEVEDEDAEYIEENIYTSNIVDFIEEEEESEEDEEDGGPTVKKKKAKATNYGRIASAIGKIKTTGTEIAPPDINESIYTFSPDVDHNTIRYGMSGITRIGEDLIQEIILNRPYYSVDDFFNKVKVNKPQAISLIKSGAFDAFGEREKVMRDYILSISGAKTDLNLRNMQMLMTYGLLPDSLDFERRVFNFNKYLKKSTFGDRYYIDNTAYVFYEKYFNVDLIDFSAHEEYVGSIGKKDWDKIYSKVMDKVRDYIKSNKEKLLEELNGLLTKDVWEKYAVGSLSKWEMDSVSFYYHEHELARVPKDIYNISNFFDLNEEPEEEYSFTTKEGFTVRMNKLYRIAGTVLAKDKTKHSVTILTEDGVVNVKVWNSQFAKYDKQISEKQADGKKKVIEKSYFSRGNKILFTGIRRGADFIPKVYKNSEWKNPIQLITSIDEQGFLELKSERDGE